jgi:hypothetical protein
MGVTGNAVHQIRIPGFDSLRNIPRSSSLLSRPVRAIKAAVLNRLRDVLRLQVRRIVKVSDGSGYFQDAVVGARAQALLGHGAFEEAFAVGGEFAVGADVAGGHLGVAVEFFAGTGEAGDLLLAGADDAFTNFGGVLRFVGGAHFFEVYGPGTSMWMSMRSMSGPDIFEM